MRRKYIRFKGEANSHLGLPRTSRIVIKTLEGNVVSEFLLEGVSPEDLNEKTIMIDVELATAIRESKTRELQREDLTEEDWKTIQQMDWAVPYRDTYD